MSDPALWERRDRRPRFPLRLGSGLRHEIDQHSVAARVLFPFDPFAGKLLQHLIDEREPLVEKLGRRLNESLEIAGGPVPELRETFESSAVSGGERVRARADDRACRLPRLSPCS